MNNYEIFYQLHHAQQPLILANAWNVKSAQIVEKNGYKAIATSSAAIANSLGYEDGEKIPFSELLFMVQRIKAGISLPLSVDMESGYSTGINEVITNIEKLLDIGVVGINMEDTLHKEIVPADAFSRKLSSIKNHFVKNNRPLFINARTDGFLLNLPNALETTLERVKLYKDAGADSIFVPFVKEEDTIKKIVAATSLPVNVLCMPGLHSIKTLADCGVRRISMGSYLFRAHYSHLDTLLTNVNEEQSFSPLF